MIYKTRLKTNGIKNIKLDDILILIEIFLIVYESGTVPSMLSMSESPLTKGLLLLIGAYYLIKSMMSRKNLTCLVLWLFLVSTYTILNLFNYAPSTPNFLYRAAIFIIMFYVYRYSRTRGIDIIIYLFYVIIFFAYTSLLIYLCIHVIHISLPYSIFSLRNRTGVYANYYNYFGLYYDMGYPNIMFGMTVYRMTGPFWEAGVFQIFLNLALYIYIRNNFKKRLSLIVILLDIILSFSTAGIVTACFLFAVMIYRGNKISKRGKIVIGIFVSIFAMIAIYSILSMKIGESFRSRGSSFIRLNDFLLGLQLFKDNFLIGTGFFNTDPFVRLNTFNETITKGSSNGLLTICFTTGIIGLIFTLLPFIYNFNKCEKHDKFLYLIYCIIIFIFNSVEPVYYLPLMLFILGMEYADMLFKHGKSDFCKVQNDE